MILVQVESITEALNSCKGLSTPPERLKNRKQSGPLVNTTELEEYIRLSAFIASASKNDKAQAWKRLNSEKVIASHHKRRAKQRNTFIGSRDEYEAFVASARSRPRVRCHWCRKSVAKGDRHIDHIIPLAKGGADHVHNLCVACSTCNISKKDRLPEQWHSSGQMVLQFTPVAEVPRKADADSERYQEQWDRWEAWSRQREHMVTTKCHLVPLCRGNVAFLPLTRGMYAMVSLCDWERVRPHLWHVSQRHGRLRAKSNTAPHRWLDRFLLDSHSHETVLSINGNRMDCTRENTAVRPRGVLPGPACGSYPAKLLLR